MTKHHQIVRFHMPAKGGPIDADKPREALQETLDKMQNDGFKFAGMTLENIHEPSHYLIIGVRDF